MQFQSLDYGWQCSYNAGWFAEIEKEREEKADQNFSGHLGYAGRQECFSQPYDTLNELIYLCNTALDHHKDIKVVSEQMDNVHNRLKYGTSMITYDRSKV